MCVMRRTDDPLLYAEEAAAVAGISRSTWTTYELRGLPKHNPLPPHEDVVLDRGHARRRWRRSAVLAWMAARPGVGGRPRRAE
jgi:predicted DNA-binding transcriptional regulator AlpA